MAVVRNYGKHSEVVVVLYSTSEALIVLLGKYSKVPCNSWPLPTLMLYKQAQPETCVENRKDFNVLDCPPAQPVIFAAATLHP